jgi:hypothetical protein
MIFLPICFGTMPDVSGWKPEWGGARVTASANIAQPLSSCR